NLDRHCHYPSRMAHAITAITVYCGSALGRDPGYAACAEAVGRELARRGITLVYGGGGIGLMGTVSKACKQAGGRVEGIITEQFLKLEQGWQGCDELVVVPGMRERKALLESRAQAFLVLPGGFGTYEEFFETFVGLIIGRHPAPIGLLDVDGYFDPLCELLDHAVEEGFARPAARSLVLRDTDAVRLIDRMQRLEENLPDPVTMLPMHGDGERR
ncbi:MAG: hypothetical protein RJA05_827, partial [Planctomycetota bacterium]